MRDDRAGDAEIHVFRGGSGSIGWLAGQTRQDNDNDKYYNCCKLCLYQLSLRAVVRVWWCVVFTSMLIWVSRADVLVKT